MASTSSSLAFSLVLLVASCLLQIHQAATSDCRLTGHGCFGGEAALSLDIQNRKMLGDSLEKTRKDEDAGFGDVKKGGGMNGNGKKTLVGWELRKVPSGPDPLHHNGNAPKKPRTDP